MVSPASIWPRWPRRAWISGCSGAVEPMIASVDRAEITNAEFAARHASNSPASAKAVENCVPLIKASPSFGPNSSGVRPAAASAAPPGMTRPSNSASPWPIIAAAIWAKGARSPEAPTDPCAGITGVTPRSSMASIRSTTSSRTPEAPRPRLSSLSAIKSRAWPRGIAGPTPQQCDRIRLRCSVAVSSEAILTEASLPKPVFTP